MVFLTPQPNLEFFLNLKEELITRPRLNVFVKPKNQKLLCEKTRMNKSIHQPSPGMETVAAGEPTSPAGTCRPTSRTGRRTN